MQIVYLSDRPDVFEQTWRHVSTFMGWADRAVVVTPRRRVADMPVDPAVTVLSDEDVTSLSGNELSALDHVRRNVRLRRSLVRSDVLDDVFLLSDDDYRPLKAVTPDRFTGDRGDIGYYCYDLAAWPGNSTPFDTAQHTTRDALSYLGSPQRSYGSHMPQIMRLDLIREAFDTLEGITTDPMICEWSLYFNLGLARHADRFDAPRPFETLCWPQYAGEWPWWVRPTEITFENFYPDLYREGHLFAGLPTDVGATESETVRTNFEKIVRWSTFARKSAALDFRDDVANPWTQESMMRKGAFSGLRRMRKAYEYLAQQDRALLTELAGTVRQLSDEVSKGRPGQH